MPLPVKKKKITVLHSINVYSAIKGQNMFTVLPIMKTRPIYVQSTVICLQFVFGHTHTRRNVYSCLFGQKKVTFTVFSIRSSLFGHLDSVILTSVQILVTKKYPKWLKIAKSGSVMVTFRVQNQIFFYLEVNAYKFLFYFLFYFLFIQYPPSSGIAPCVRTTWKWYRHHTLAKPCLAALGLVLILGQTSNILGLTGPCNQHSFLSSLLSLARLA